MIPDNLYDMKHEKKAQLDKRLYNLAWYLLLGGIFIAVLWSVTFGLIDSLFAIWLLWRIARRVD